MDLNITKWEVCKVTPTVSFIAMTCLKLATAGTVSLGLVTFFKFFNDFELKGKKKGVKEDDSTSHIENFRKRVRSED